MINSIPSNLTYLVCVSFSFGFLLGLLARKIYILIKDKLPGLFISKDAMSIILSYADDIFHIAKKVILEKNAQNIESGKDLDLDIPFITDEVIEILFDDHNTYTDLADIEDGDIFDIVSKVIKDNIGIILELCNDIIKQEKELKDADITAGGNYARTEPAHAEGDNVMSMIDGINQYYTNYDNDDNNV